MKCMLSILAGLVLLVAASPAADPLKPAKKKDTAMSPVKDVPGLPRVLLIGDSISIGYTVPVRAMMKGVANVHRPLTNCGPTIKGLASIDDWLGDGKWDVIHFNWGLHDLKYMGPGGKSLVDPESEGARHQVAIDVYEKNLDALVVRMKKTGAKLIWRNTTPVPPGAKGRVVGDSKKYNQAAARVMEKHGVPTHDMYAFCMPRMKEIMRRANVHFTPAGSKALAETVVAEIQKALKE